MSSRKARSRKAPRKSSGQKRHPEKAAADTAPPAPPFVPVSDDQIIRTPELSRWTGFAPITLRIFRLRGEGPIYSKLNRTVVYRVADVKLWLLQSQPQRREALRP
jgi:hypothetical protein